MNICEITLQYEIFIKQVSFPSWNKINLKTICIVHRMALFLKWKGGNTKFINNLAG